jgi:Zn-dependent membrane protease YugP
MNTKKIIGILIFILWVVCKGNILFAQDTLITRHPIEVKATNRDGKVLKFKQIIKAANAEELPEAAKHFRRAQVFDIVGKTLGFPGAFIVGYSLGSALS